MVTLASAAWAISWSSGRPKKASTAATAHASVVGLVAAVQREEEVVERAERGAQVEHVAAHRRPVGDDVEVGRRASRPRAGPRRGTPTGAAGRARPAQERVGLDDAGLLRGDGLAPVALAVGVVLADVGDHGDVGVDDVGGVVAAEQPDLDHRHVDRVLGEAQRRPPAVSSSKYDGSMPEQRLEAGQLGDQLGELRRRRSARPFQEMRSLTRSRCGLV